MSTSVNSLFKKGPVSSGVDGPPMFIMSTAVFGLVSDPDEDGDDGEEDDSDRTLLRGDQQVDLLLRVCRERHAQASIHHHANGRHASVQDMRLKRRRLTY